MVERSPSSVTIPQLATAFAQFTSKVDINSPINEIVVETKKLIVEM